MSYADDFTAFMGNTPMYEDRKYYVGYIHSSSRALPVSISAHPDTATSYSYRIPFLSSPYHL
jgi:hypothetical protein